MRLPSPFLLLVLCLAAGLPGLATAAAAAAPAAAAADTDGSFGAGDRSMPVGEATRSLLALQRGGSLASDVARPIDGDVAGRSYQRYLKSFEQPIPDRYGTVNGSGSAGGASGH